MIMIRYTYNDKLRIKVTDQCDFSCPFCHAEGGMGAENIVLDNNFVEAIKMLQPIFKRAHITGGEPVLYKNLNRILDVLQDTGYRVSITSNGFFALEKNIDILERFDYINFSVHSFRNDYVSQLIKNHLASEHVVSIVKKNIDELRKIVPVRINTVVSDRAKQQNLEEIIEYCGERSIELKLVPEWKSRAEAKKYIDILLDKNGFSLYETVYLIPGSNVRKRYRNKYGQIIEVKNIEFFFPNFICHDCSIKENCQEGFSFLRMGGNPLYLQPCIFKPKMNVEEFRQNMLEDLYNMFREAEKNCLHS